MCRKWSLNKLASPLPALDSRYPLFLAVLAVETGSLPLPDLLDRCTTFATWFAATPIHPIMLLEIAGLSGGIDEIAQGAAAMPDGFVERCKIKGAVVELNYQLWRKLIIRCVSKVVIE